MRLTWGGFWLVIGLSVVCLCSTPALAFEQTKTCTDSGAYACGPGETPKEVHWTARCVPFKINEDGSDNFVQASEDVPAIEEIRREIFQSFEAWTRVDCSDMTLVFDGMTGQSDTTYSSDSDNYNLVVLRDEGWEQIASARAFALSSVTFNPKNGVIYRSDIQVNTEFYPYSGSKQPPPNHVDLRNTMTHEVGHFIGLDHTDVTDATMFATAPIGEIAKRTLHQDDIAGVCHVYPSTDRSRAECSSASDFPPRTNLDQDVDDGLLCSLGASATPAGGDLPLVAAAVLGLMLVWRRRR